MLNKCKTILVFLLLIVSIITIGEIGWLIHGLQPSKQNINNITGNFSDASRDAKSVTGNIKDTITPQMLQQYNEGFAEALMRQSVQQRVLMGELNRIGKSTRSFLDGELTSTTSELRSVIADLRPRLNTQLEATTEATNAITAMLVTSEKGIATTFEDVHAKMEQLNTLYDRVNVVMSEEVLVKFRDAGLDTMVELNGTVREVHGISANLNQTTASVNNVVKFYEGKLIPKEKVYSKNGFKRFFQKAGDITWTVVKTGAGTAMLIFDVYRVSKGIR
jgi:hypothetical protein